MPFLSECHSAEDDRDITPSNGGDREETRYIAPSANRARRILSNGDTIYDGDSELADKFEEIVNRLDIWSSPGLLRVK